MQLRFVLAVAGRYTNDCYYAVFPVCVMC